MKTCPGCGRKFNWLQRAAGEHKEHLRTCDRYIYRNHHEPISTGCRGCPAGCYERVDFDEGGSEKG